MLLTGEAADAVRAKIETVKAERARVNREMQGQYALVMSGFDRAVAALTSLIEEPKAPEQPAGSPAPAE